MSSHLEISASVFTVVFTSVSAVETYTLGVTF